MNFQFTSKMTSKGMISVSARAIKNNGKLTKIFGRGLGMSIAEARSEAVCEWYKKAIEYRRLNPKS